MYVKGGQVGAIAYNGQTVIELFDIYCVRHPEIKKMRQIIQQDEDGTIIYYKSCPKCYQLVEEGRYKKEEARTGKTNV